jgi:hypothetical protein
MFKTIIPFYIICFTLYVFFTRQPDYLDGKFTTGVIHYIKDSTQKPVAKVFFTIDKTTYAEKAAYTLRNLRENESVPVIYDTSNPANGAVYTWWGYWLQWDELLASVFFTVLLYYGANAITSNPTPETLIEELEDEENTKRKKYN